MKYKGIKEIQIEGFKLLQIGTSTDITTAKTVYNRLPSNYNGGIYLELDFEFEPSDNGFVFFSQVSRKHRLSILTTDNQKHDYNVNSTLKDTVYKNESFYREKEDVFNVESGKLQKPIIFWDAPFMELMNHYKNLEYEIYFENWIQFNNSGEITPILSFEWSLMGRVQKNDEIWEILEVTHSSIEDIKNSIKIKTIFDMPFLIRDLEHLQTNTQIFLEEVINSMGK